MGVLSNRVDRAQIKAGDHIYSWRAAYTYSHHGIYVGGNKVVHFTREQDPSSNTNTPFGSFRSSSRTQLECMTFPDCGFRRPNSGVVLSCLDCFLGSGCLYCFEYGVPASVFLAKVRGGTCTTAESDPPETVIHRAMYLLQNGFGNYNVFRNNCEDFALYCKTGLLIVENTSMGRSGQASSLVGAKLAALVSSPLKLFMAGPVGVATFTAGMYCVSRYATDIGVRKDVIKVQVEDMAVKLGWNEEVIDEKEGSEGEIRSSTNLRRVDNVLFLFSVLIHALLQSLPLASALVLAVVVFAAMSLKQARNDSRHLFLSVVFAGMNLSIAAFVRANAQKFCNRPRLHKPRG
ncbi:hypothetical protein MRB53_026961 [Persea americana]|uniref:Uncharacterized protein n=1 Tax=Persea americana TaxID=3435 RepID=A0ACC2LJU3_PERAE|nr:hypothetical protein MRB53_026961 [Persea americana]